MCIDKYILSCHTCRLPAHLQPELYGNLEKGDKILEINGVPIKNQDQSEVPTCISMQYVKSQSM